METLAGFLLARLGHIPVAGESVDFGGRRFAVQEMEEQRISRVRVTPLGGEKMQGTGSRGLGKGDRRSGARGQVTGPKAEGEASAGAALAGGARR